MAGKAKKKITFTAKVIIKGKKVPDFGLGKGVLLQQDIVVTDSDGRGAQSPLLAAALLDQEERLLAEVVEVVFERKRVKNGKKEN